VPRKWLETVQDWPVLIAGHSYEMRITDVERSSDPPGMRVQLGFVSVDEAGRTHVALLPLPIRPAGLSADFFRAAGVDVIAGGTVTPKAVVGTVVQAQFAQGEDGQWQIVRFAPAEEC
jgi:hypothetical protein